MSAQRKQQAEAIVDAILQTMNGCGVKLSLDDSSSAALDNMKASEVIEGLRVTIDCYLEQYEERLQAAA